MYLITPHDLEQPALCLKESNERHIAEADGKETHLSIADQTIVGTSARSRRPRLTPDEQREIALLYTDRNASPAELRTRFGIGDATLYRLLRKQGITLRGRSASAHQARKADGGHVAVGQEPSRRGRRRSGPGKTQPSIQAAHRSTNGASLQFRVTYSAVQTVQAADILGALHHTETFGATDVREIKRQD